MGAAADDDSVVGLHGAPICIGLAAFYFCGINAWLKPQILGETKRDKGTKMGEDKPASLIGFCGIDCGECKAFIATKNKDFDLKKTLAAEWSKNFGRDFKPEDINCVGCTSVNGSHIGYCAVCQIRTCGIKRGLQNCAFCIEYGCEKLENIHSRSPKAKEQLEKIHKKIKEK